MIETVQGFQSWDNFIDLVIFLFWLHFMNETACKHFIMNIKPWMYYATISNLPPYNLFGIKRSFKMFYREPHWTFFSKSDIRVQK